MKISELIWMMVLTASVVLAMTESLQLRRMVRP